MQTLMELVNECAVHAEAKEISPELAESNLLLAELGFKRAARTAAKKIDLTAKLAKLAEYSYITITNDKIKAFLNRKVAAYNAMPEIIAVEPRDSERFTSALLSSMMLSTIWGNPQRGPTTDIIDKHRVVGETKHRFESKGIGKFEWVETPISEYAGVPPIAVLRTLKEHKARAVFDYFTVATVNEVADPLLLGRLTGHADRYFLAQWGDDVALDDLI